LDGATTFEMPAASPSLDETSSDNLKLPQELLKPSSADSAKTFGLRSARPSCAGALKSLGPSPGPRQSSRRKRSSRPSRTCGDQSFDNSVRINKQSTIGVNVDCWCHKPPRRPLTFHITIRNGGWHSHQSRVSIRVR
jgi:hypothetical protein